MMRIITGRARGTKLLTLEGEITRPTTERAKEAIFSILYTDVINRKVLDLFAGSGQLGLEAISRGAESATFVEASTEALAVLKKNIAKTHFEKESTVVGSDYREFLSLQKGNTGYDLIFLDPPYASKAVGEALQLLLQFHLIDSNAIIVCETAECEDVFWGQSELKNFFSVFKQVRYGKAVMTFLKPSICDHSV